MTDLAKYVAEGKHKLTQEKFPALKDRTLSKLISWAAQAATIVAEFNEGKAELEQELKKLETLVEVPQAVPETNGEQQQEQTTGETPAAA